MKGHVTKRGSTWAFVIDTGRQPVQRCGSEACTRTVARQGKANVRHPLYWLDDGKKLDACPKCGGVLEETTQRRLRWVGGFATKRAADAEYAKRLNLMEQGGNPFPEDMALRDYLGQWVEHQRSRLRPRTLQRYQQLLDRYVLPRLGSLPLRKLGPAHVQEVIDRAAETGIAPRTVLHIYRVFSTALRQAVRWQLLAANPAAAVQPPRPERPRLAVPTAVQLLGIIEAAKGTTWEIPILLASTTGARRSEVLGLRWADVDLETKRARIVQGLQRVPSEGGGSKLVFLGLKTQRSRREVTLPLIALDRLRRHRQEQTERRLALGPGWQDHDLVCERGDGHPLDPGEFSHAVKRIFAKAGVPPTTRLHDLRHGVATALLGQGVHPGITSALLGHSSPAFTMSQYQHVLDGMTDQAADALDQAFGEGSAGR